jgi:signal transduction histidine kinase
MTAKKILVIEDVHYLRNDVLEMLRFEGYDVEGAENGLLGVETARSFNPDLIICDIMMPGLNGFEVLKVLRADPKTRTIPFIFLTAKTDRLDMRQGMGLGADDYITKPFYSNELLETISARLQARQYYQEQAEQRTQSIIEKISMALPHELRTPLNTIMGFSDILMMEAFNIKPDQVVEWAQHINNAALRLYRLIENYLTYVRIESTMREPQLLEQLLERETFQPGSIVESMTGNRAKLAGRENDLHMDINAASTARISEDDLGRIVDSLVDNAFKFSEKGMPVKVLAAEQDSRLVITVRDEGRGMSASDIASVGAYMQFDRMIYEQQGTGLGLIIAKRLAELYGGSLDIISEKGAGTTVTVTLLTKPE